MNLMYFVNSLIIIIIMSYDIFVTRSCDFENLVIKFITIFLKDFFEIEND